MKIIHFFYLTILLFNLTILLATVSCTLKSDIKNDELINYELYQGKWYEIARLPNSIEREFICITMTYEYKDDGIMLVSASGKNRSNLNEIKSFTAKAWIPDKNEPQKIKMQFIWPVTLDFRLIHIDEKKGHAIIGSPNRRQLWILSREPMMSGNDISELKLILEKNQYNIELLIYVDQICD